jgi:hypothetical protein
VLNNFLPLHFGEAFMPQSVRDTLPAKKHLIERSVKLDNLKQNMYIHTAPAIMQ